MFFEQQILQQIIENVICNLYNDKDDPLGCPRDQLRYVIDQIIDNLKNEIIEKRGQIVSKYVFDEGPMHIVDIMMLTLDESKVPKFTKTLLRDTFSKVIHKSDIQKFERMFKEFAKGLFSN